MSFGNQNNQCSSEAPAIFVRQNNETENHEKSFSVYYDKTTSSVAWICS